MTATTVHVTKTAAGLTICPTSWDNLPRDLLNAVAVVAGGAVVLNPEYPDQEMGAEINDIDAAAWWLEGVFGEDVARAALAGDESAEVAVKWGTLAAPLRRVAMGTWLLRWWPTRSAAHAIAGLDELLLVADIGTAAWEAEPCMPDPDLTASLLQESTGAIVQAAAQVQRLSGAELDAADALLWRAARAAHHEGDPSTPEWRAVYDLLEAKSEADSAVAQTLATLEQFLATREGQSAPVSVPAFVAGDEGWDDEWWQAVDWAQVNPRTVGADDQNILITRKDCDQGTQVIVRVQAGDEASQGLVARVYRQAYELPIAHIRLELTDRGYVGEAIVPDYGQDLVVDVYEPSFAGRPRSTENAASTRARVRQIVSGRLVSPVMNPAGPFLCEFFDDA